LQQKLDTVESASSSTTTKTHKGTFNSYDPQLVQQPQPQQHPGEKILLYDITTASLLEQFKIETAETKKTRSKRLSPPLRTVVQPPKIRYKQNAVNANISLAG
jgi:hypothetical protein